MSTTASKARTNFITPPQTLNETGFYHALEPTIISTRKAVSDYAENIEYLSWLS